MKSIPLSDKEQRMLWYGIAWLDDKPYGIWKKKNITSLGATRFPLAEEGLTELEEIWKKKVGRLSGKSKEMIIEHLKFIHIHGYLRWINRQPVKIDVELGELFR